MCVVALERSRAQRASDRAPEKGPASAREGIPGRAGKRDLPGAGQRDDHDVHAAAVPVGVAACANSDGVW